MPTYSVRLYHTYCNEYKVDAPTMDDAIDIADMYDDLKSLDTPDHRAALAYYEDTVEVVGYHQYEDTETTCNELDADGNWLE